MGVIGLLFAMGAGLSVLALLVVFLVFITRRSDRRVVLDLPEGTAVTATPTDGSLEITGTLIRTDNDYALIEVEGVRQFVPRSTLRPADHPAGQQAPRA